MKGLGLLNRGYALVVLLCRLQQKLLDHDTRTPTSTGRNSHGNGNGNGNANNDNIHHHNKHDKFTERKVQPSRLKRSAPNSISAEHDVTNNSRKRAKTQASQTSSLQANPQPIAGTSDEDPANLHPSWAAKKKQQQLVAFQGKRVVFD